MIRRRSQCSTLVHATSTLAAIALVGLALPAHAGELGSMLRQIVDAQASGRPQAMGAATRVPGVRLKPLPDGQQGIVVIAEPRIGLSGPRVDHAGLEALGAAVDSVSRGPLRLLVPPNRLAAVAAHADLDLLRLPLVPTPTDYGTVVPTGPAAVLAARYWNEGWVGAGVKIAVVDFGFQQWQARVAQGELPPNTLTVDFTGNGVEGTIVHGTAVAEVVMDVAPAAELHLLHIGDLVDLQNAADYCAVMGIDVVNHSGAWAQASYYDGTGAVNNVVTESRLEDGVLWVVSSGNGAESHWRGGHRDANSDGWIEFDDSGAPRMELEPVAGQELKLFLNWNQYNGPVTNLDLWLYRQTGPDTWAPIASSQVSQTGEEWQRPDERVSLTPEAGERYAIAIRHAGGPIPDDLDITIIAYDTDLANPIAASSVTDPASAPAAVAVGAVNPATYGGFFPNIEPFSSQGPTTDGRLKPDITAPDRQMNATYGSLAYGTSFSSPVAAGVAALHLSRWPGRDLDEIVRLMRGSVADGPPTGPDDIYGYGKVRMPLAENLPPVTGDDYYVLNEGAAPFVATVLANDTDPTGDAITVIGVDAGGVVGTATAVPNGVRYTPLPGAHGVERLRYYIRDAAGSFELGWVTFEVQPVSDAPVAVDDTATVVSDDAIDIVVTANDTDADGDDLGVAAVTQPANGQAVVISWNVVRYTSQPGFTGDDSFTYTVTDGGLESAPATVTVTVMAPPASCNDGDLRAPDVSLARPIVVHELVDGPSSPIFNLVEQCEMTWTDDCDGPELIVHDARDLRVVGVDGEVITGGPGAFVSSGIAMNDYEYQPNLDRNGFGPRRYTVEYRVRDSAGNARYASCEIRVVDPLALDWCNGIDDDADGEIDEDFVSQATTCGLGTCTAAGITECNGGIFEDTCVPGAPNAQELCDGVDDDCDGETDEGYFLNGLCWNGVGECSRMGRIVCGADQLSWMCDAVPGDPEPERCGNFDDDDCDGQTDEGYDLGAPCSEGVGVCARDGTIVCAPGGFASQCSAVPAPPADELCDNGADEDCDGEVDELECTPDLGCEPDVVGPVINVGQPEVIFELADGFVQNRTPLAQACEMTWIDRCYDGGYLHGIIDIAVDSPDGEVMGGEPGYFQSSGMLADWHDIMLDLDRNNIGPRDYTITYRVLDILGNTTDAECVVRVIDPLAGPPDDCNGIDDDGDGEIDEDFVGGIVTCGVGFCQSEGVTFCADGGVHNDCQPRQGIPERCNDVDDDCDGETDEDFVLGDACSAGVGVCRADGFTICAPDRVSTVCDAVPGAAIDELCGNGIDDDCDGETDEGFALRVACSAGVGLCRADGLTVCAPDGDGTACDASVGDPAPELCGTGEDEDCDGEIDEGFDLGAPCTVGIGACARDGNASCSADGLSLACDATAGDPSQELCGNGIDDDCDGEIDEGFGAGELCAAGVGACRRDGTVVCAPDGISASCDAVPGDPTDELCGNGVDDNCDGTTDEGFIVGAPCSVGVGACAADGQSICTADGTGVTCGATAGEPSDEICENGADEDCDGAVDEAECVPDTSCEPDVTGPIVTVANPEITFELQDGDVANRTAVAAACGMSWIDTCFDGSYLHGIADLTVDSPDGEIIGGEPGYFQSPGILAEWHDIRLNLNRNTIGPRTYTVTYRVLDNLWNTTDVECVVRVVDPLAPPTDDCNGFDDDGDGEIDEDFAPAPGTCGTGACTAAGMTACIGGEVMLECTPGDPTDELCGSGVDEDCDGLTDEGFDNGDPCQAGVGACLSLGQRVCAADGTTTECNAVPGAAADELCGTGVDEDCDGTTDEGFATGDACQAGIGACLADGVTVCTTDGTGVECNAVPGLPGDELCGNGVDDDCNGQTDEGFDLGAQCTGGLGLCAADGLTICAPDGRGTVCDAPTSPPGDELCGTGEDEDCDGEIDEGFDTGAPCAVGIGECARQGNGSCSADRLSLVCDALPGDPTDELCGNDLDEDCDGEIDEGFGEGDACTVGIGACAGDGILVCIPDGTATECDAVPGAPAEELCGTGIDEDCDGEIDEGFPPGEPCPGEEDCGNDQTPPRVDVGQPVFEVEQRDVPGWQRFYVTDVCQLTWTDGCMTPDQAIHGINLLESTTGEDIMGAPGGYYSAGITAEWHYFDLNLARAEVGPREYAIRYAVIDRTWNWAFVDCTVRVVDAIAPLGCTDDTDCAQGETCDVDTGECQIDAPAAVSSDFGVFAAFTHEFAAFAGQMGLTLDEYRAWAGGQMNALGAHWTRSNVQLVWDNIEAELGGEFDWETSGGGEIIFASASEYGVQYLGVFHEGGSRDGSSGRPSLRDPLEDLVANQRFIRAAVERYDGDGIDDNALGIVIKYWQFGNETGGWTAGGRTYAEYADWFEAAATAARQADPDAHVVMIASTDATRVDPLHAAALPDLALRGVRVDAVDLHHWGSADNYVMSAAPIYRRDYPDVELWSTEHGTYVGMPWAEPDPSRCQNPCAAGEVCVAAVGRCVPACVDSSTCPASRPECIVETGMCTYPAQTETDQARSLVYRYAANRAAGVTHIMWNNLAAWRCFGNRCGGIYDLIGLVHDNNGPTDTPENLGEPRLSWHTYQRLAARTDNPFAENTGEYDTGDPLAHAFSYRRIADGATGYVAWSDAPTEVDLPIAGATQALIEALITDVDGMPLREELVPVDGPAATVLLDADPVWIAPPID